VDNGNGTGVFDWTPDSTQESNYSVTFQVSDTAGAIDFETVNITVTRTNIVPVLAAIGAQNVDENSNLIVPVTATDFDGDPLTLTALTLPTGATLTG